MTSRPVDPTTTGAWARLGELARCDAPDLRTRFADDPDRARRWTFDAADLHVDLSRNLLDEDVVAALLGLAEETGVAARREAMFAGERVNVTEDRSVLHTALRRPRTDSLTVEGSDVVAQVHDVLDRMYAFADQVRSGEWRGWTGHEIRTVVNLGIGGSDLGPAMAYEALAAYRHPDLSVRFISNIDPTDATQALAGLDPRTTLFIVSSKTFTTLETLTNARVCRQWLLEGLAEYGLAEADTSGAVARHFVAVSTNLEAVADFGIDPANAFGFWDWVGGRYSLDSAIGTSLALAVGPERFAEFLAGFHAMDRHFVESPAERNVPLLMGLLNVWYVNFLGAQAHAVLPYSQLLHRFPAYLQQLTMESNGKRVRADGSPLSHATGEIFWGEPGTNGQHAFYQLLHQGTLLVPADFIGFANPSYAVAEGGTDLHQLLIANLLAQTKALAFGRTDAEVRAEGTPEALVAARVSPGNRPTTTVLADQLTPAVLGQLIALYEHITFVQGAVWGVDSFDQWGVELGKQMATAIGPALDGDPTALDAQDSATRALVDWYRENRR